ncbi:hypothetical protein [Myceligenerans crystallogenes]|uniref:Uncharacterized protein n=1 Tax=Myceligenerans crystallogenes TaxID=316335 RepID=A0ABP4ZGG2_9MICO
MAKLTVIDWRALAALGLGVPYAGLWLAEAQASGNRLAERAPSWVDTWANAVADVMSSGAWVFPIWFVTLVLLLGGAGLAAAPAIREPGDRRYPVINLVIALGLLAAFGWAAWTVGNDYYVSSVR